MLPRAENVRKLDKTLDLRIASRGTQLPGGETLIAVIDEKSLAELGRWPWSRAIIARLVDAQVLSLEPGHVLVRYAVKPEFMHPGRAVQGGATAGRSAPARGALREATADSRGLQSRKRRAAG